MSHPNAIVPQAPFPTYNTHESQAPTAEGEGSGVRLRHLWLLGPAADGLCPACRAPCSFAFGEDASCSLSVSGAEKKGLLALSHPALLQIVPRAPPPSRSASRFLSSSSYASYPTSPASPSSSGLGSPTSSESEEEDRTDYSLPALIRARALQTRRHSPHPFSSVLGVRGALASVIRVVGWVVVVAALARSGRSRPVVSPWLFIFSLDSAVFTACWFLVRLAGADIIGSSALAITAIFAPTIIPGNAALGRGYYFANCVRKYETCVSMSREMKGDGDEKWRGEVGARRCSDRSVGGSRRRANNAGRKYQGVDNWRTNSRTRPKLNRVKSWEKLTSTKAAREKQRRRHISLPSAKFRLVLETNRATEPEQEQDCGNSDCGKHQVQYGTQLEDELCPEDGRRGIVTR
ncbi:hypothetical protein C8R44DRAFT_899445 [Mycena epipterygia]|nr:hypothetical protein C8R44DRAFT_899445 [Mycena epipterygia]